MDEEKFRNLVTIIISSERDTLSEQSELEQFLWSLPKTDRLKKIVDIAVRIVASENKIPKDEKDAAWNRLEKKLKALDL